MSDDYKKRVMGALTRHHEKLLPKSKRVRSKVHNDNPESRLVLDLLLHMRAMGWLVERIDSTAVWTPSAGAYMKSMAPVGYSDISGNTPDGLAVYIEVKAPGKRSSLRPDQREFLISKINTSCFAIVCDSIDYFNTAWAQFGFKIDRVGYLLSSLPKKPAGELARDVDLSFDE